MYEYDLYQSKCGGEPLHPDIVCEGSYYFFTMLMDKNYQSPKDADPKILWALLRTKYKDGDEMVDSESMIWDVWRKGEGYALYCSETKEVVEVPKPELGG